jgi:hypothetical protein
MDPDVGGCVDRLLPGAGERLAAASEAAFRSVEYRGWKLHPAMFNEALLRIGESASAT